jgi:hypothetical protein
VAAHPGAVTRDVRQRLGKPRATVDRQLQALQMLGVLVCDEHEDLYQGRPVTRWSYRLASGIDPTVLVLDDHVPDLSPHAHSHNKKEEGEDVESTDEPLAADNSGNSIPTATGSDDDSDKYRV